MYVLFLKLIDKCKTNDLYKMKRKQTISIYIDVRFSLIVFRR